MHEQPHEQHMKAGQMEVFWLESKLLCLLSAGAIGSCELCDTVPFPSSHCLMWLFQADKLWAGKCFSWLSYISSQRVSVRGLADVALCGVARWATTWRPTWRTASK
jgi:hypothetical protein